MERKKKLGRPKNRGRVGIQTRTWTHATKDKHGAFAGFISGKDLLELRSRAKKLKVKLCGVPF